VHRPRSRLMVREVGNHCLDELFCDAVGHGVPRPKPVSPATGCQSKLSACDRPVTGPSDSDGAGEA
jgi:hypothetical protein